MIWKRRVKFFARRDALDVQKRGVDGMEENIKNGSARHIYGI